MGSEVIDNVSTILVVGGAIALIACGVTVAKPNLHGVKFEEGTCQIILSSQRPFWNDLPRCSCGKNCQEEYPCVTVRARFDYSKLNYSSFTGSIHHNYYAVDQDCLFIPECDNDFNKNAQSVYSYFVRTIVPLVNYDMRYPYLQGFNQTEIVYKNASTFSCWGYNGAIYIDHSYNMQKVYLSLCIPAGCLLLGLALSFICGSDEHRDCFVELIGLPFLFIVGIFMAIYALFGCKNIRCCKPSCHCFSRGSSDNDSNVGNPDISLADIEISRARRRIAPSLELEVRRPRLSSADISITASSPSRSFSRSFLDLRLFSAGEAPELVPEPTCPQEVSYPSSVAPPSYDNVQHADRGPSLNFNTPVGIIAGPAEASSYTGDLPPPPSYDDVMDY